MNAEHLLDAIGRVDDELIREAELYVRERPKPNYSRWLGLAASFAVVLVLGYGVTHLSVGGGNSGAPASSNTASGGAAGNSAAEVLPPHTSDVEALVPNSPNEADPDSPMGAGSNESGDWHAAIMVDGTLYWSTGKAVSVEVDESEARTVTAYINTLPEMDGQTNFSPDLTARYVMTDMGLVVWMDGKWVLFDETLPWER